MAAAASIQHPARLAAMTAPAPDTTGVSATNDFAVTLDAVVGHATATPDRPSQTNASVSQNAGLAEAQRSAGQAPAAPALSDLAVAVAAVRSSPKDTKPAGKVEAPSQAISAAAVTEIPKTVTDATAFAGIAGLVAPPATPLARHGATPSDAVTADGKPGAAPAAPLTSAPPGSTGSPATPATAAEIAAATPAIADPAMAVPLLQGSQAAALQPSGSPAAAAKRTAAVAAAPSGSAGIRGVGAVVSVTLAAASSAPAIALVPAPASPAVKGGAVAAKAGKLEPYHAAMPASGAAAVASDTTATGLPPDSAPTAAPDAKGALSAPSVAMAATIAPGDGSNQPSASPNRAVMTDGASIGGGQQPVAGPMFGPSSADAGAQPASGGFPPPVEQIAPALVALAASRAAGTRRLSVTMAPVELGRVAVTVERVGDGTARISVTAERPETLQLLQKEHTQLSQLLDNAGVGAEGRSLSFSLTGGNETGGNGTGGNGGSPSHSGQGQPNGGGWPQGQPLDTGKTTAAPPARWQRSGVDITA